MPWPAACKDGSQLYMVVCFHLDPTAAERVSRGGAPLKVAIASDQTAEVDGVQVLQGMRFHIVCGILLHPCISSASSSSSTERRRRSSSTVRSSSSRAARSSSSRTARRHCSSQCQQQQYGAQQYGAPPPQQQYSAPQQMGYAQQQMQQWQ